MPPRAHRLGQAGRVAPRVMRLVSFLGCALSVQATPAAAQVPAAVPPSRGEHSAAPPWSGVGGGDSSLPLTRARVSPPPVRHPAVHPFQAVARGQRLFPRAQDVQREQRARRQAMERHPAGKGAIRVGEPTAASRPTSQPQPVEPVVRPGPVSRSQSRPGLAAEAKCSSRHVVQPGDSLWSIAGSIEEKASVAEVAGLMQQIFALNRGTIGPDPDVIHPGQSLNLPEDCQR